MVPRSLRRISFWREKKSRSMDCCATNERERGACSKVTQACLVVQERRLPASMGSETSWTNRRRRRAGQTLGASVVLVVMPADGRDHNTNGGLPACLVWHTSQYVFHCIVRWLNLIISGTMA